MNLQLNIPLCDIEEVQIDTTGPCLIHCSEIPVQAGLATALPFDSPEKNDLKRELQLDEYSSMIRVKGDSMADIYMCQGDLLIVRHNRSAEEGDIVIAEVNGGMTVKEFHRDPETGVISLLPHNEAFSPIVIEPLKDSFSIRGIVEYSIHKYKH